MKSNKRELNTAKNKQAILQCLLKRMHCESFDSIKISDLCVDAKVSQASFYNYFPQKTDVLIYYIQLWTIEMYWQITINKKLVGLKAIEQLFADTADICAKHSQLMCEIVAYQAKNGKPQGVTPLTVADKLQAYPDFNGIENIELADLSALLVTNIQQAISVNELPDTINITSLVVALSSIFFTIPIIFNRCPLEEIKSAFSEQLQLLLCGARN